MIPYVTIIYSIALNILSIHLFCLEHLVDTPFFLLHSRVDIQVESGTDVRMSENYAYSFIVAVAFYASRREAVPELGLSSGRDMAGCHVELYPILKNVL